MADEEKNAYPKMWQRSNLENRQVVVTGRTYEEISRDMILPDGYFKEGEKALSVGEGLSNFARTIHQQGVDIISVDPIYSIPGIIDLGAPVSGENSGFWGGQSPSGENIERSNQLLEEAFGKHYGIGSFNLNQTDGPESDRIVAASATDLPFPDETFDKILSYRFLQHVDTDRVLPELIRVLKAHGEIRNGLVLMTADPDKSRLWNANFKFKPWGIETEVADNRIGECFRWIKNNRIQAYISIQSPGEQGWYSGRSAEVRTLIFRKDRELPITDGKTEVWKINSSLKYDKKFKTGYFDLTNLSRS